MIDFKSITLQLAAGYGLNIKRRNCHCEEPWAKSKGTKQSKKYEIASLTLAMTSKH